jgi:hypothetical protein
MQPIPAGQSLRAVQFGTHDPQPTSRPSQDISAGQVGAAGSQGWVQIASFSEGMSEQKAPAQSVSRTQLSPITPVSKVPETQIPSPHRSRSEQKKPSGQLPTGINQSQGWVQRNPR